MQNYRNKNTCHCRYMGTRLIVLAVGVWISLGSCSAWFEAENGPVLQGRVALRAGEYARARQLFELALKEGQNPEESQSNLLKVLRFTGGYEEALRYLEKFSSAVPDSASLLLEGGRIYRDTGDYTKAEDFLRRAVSLAAGRPELRMDAIRTLAEFLEDVGQKTEADRFWDRLIEEYLSGNLRESRRLHAVAVAAWRKGYFYDARDLFLDATDPELGEVPLEALTDFGYLFLEKYNATDAMTSFKDCLEINARYPDALVGMARAKKYENDFEVEVYSRSALEINPNNVAARNLLAGLALDAEYYEAALNEINAALQVNPTNLESLSLLAVYYFICGNTADFESTERKILSIHPTYGRFYHMLAENLVSRRKYEEAVHFSRKAIALDPELWPAYVTLGMNLSRIGEMDEGRKAMEQAFEGDGFNVWADNSLKLLDQMDTFVESESDHFRYRMSVEDAPVLSSYVAGLAEEVYAKLTRRYGFRPRGPLFVEMFPDHGGFAVRTLGLPGLDGALGACFGKVIAMDSPRVGGAGQFNWGTTLWHEFTHVITLQMTNHNIPRWFTEGLSVFEEFRARPGWGNGINLPFIKAYKEGKLLKASELNEGFTRPESPERIPLSYLQAALACEWMEEEYGFESILRALALFAENKPSEEVFLQALGLDAAAMDAGYARYMDARVGRIASSIFFETPGTASRAAAGDEPYKDFLTGRLEENPDDFLANLHLGAALQKEGAFGKAEGFLKKAQELFPQYVGDDNSYQLLSRIYLETERENEALDQLEKWIRVDDSSREPLLKAAEIYKKRRDWASLARVLNLSIYIHPYDAEIHKRLGGAALEAEDWDLAIAAYRSLVALNKTDPAEAHFDLARAFFASGDTAAAKREILQSLETAPSYRKGQKLLLEIYGE
ncbi:MAG: tetratricopeptide repeat protein [Acidobacteria bacterium]|nr:tetratricopeptide repeat protein [Acidobacteriota bacterium]